MDRLITRPGAIAVETDLAYAQVAAMIAEGYLREAVLGIGPIASGFACIPTTPASMSVVVDRGLLSQLSTIDATAFGSLPASSAPLVKAGINTAGQVIALAAPTVAGQSQSFLIQATLQELDADPLVLAYYNASNPAISWAGPNNSGTPQATHRLQRAALQVLPGVPAAAGSQTVPPATDGWVPLWIVTLAAGQTTITAGSIAQHPASPTLLFNLASLAGGLAAAGRANGLTVLPNDGALLTKLVTRRRRNAGFVVPGAFTWTCPAGVTWLDEVIVIGSGGAGGDCQTPGTQSGGGGGGGGITISRGLAVTPGTTYSGSVGAGGTAGPSGALGTASSFMGLLGQTGGPGLGFGLGQSGGGIGGLASGGNFYNGVGGYGSDGQSGSFIYPGNGAPGYLGQGGGRAQNANGGADGRAPGAGGGGAYDTGSSGTRFAGGKGGAGAVLLTWTEAP